MKTQTWFRVETKIDGISEVFVDWFPCETETAALGLARAEAVACGLPAEVTFSARVATKEEAEIVSL